MTPPRMRIGFFLEDCYTLSSSRLMWQWLAETGHSVTHLSSPSDIDTVELVIIAVSDTKLPEYATAMESYVRRGQLVAHTSVLHPVTVLEPLALQGALVMNLHPLARSVFVGDSLDEVAGTVAELLANEMGGHLIRVDDARRRDLALGMAWRHFVDVVRDEAFDLIHGALGDVELTSSVLEDNERALYPIIDVPELKEIHAGIEDPGRARAFLDFARRAAENDHHNEVELWSMQEGSRR